MKKSKGFSGSPVGYKFNTHNTELEELHLQQSSDESKSSEASLDKKLRPSLVTVGSLDSGKNEDEKLGEAVKDYWGLLGRSISVDSSYESPFSNPIETWRKLNELKGKITKTVEEKLSEMKTDHNESGSKSGSLKLFSSKENSSVSDSEDTSESSKLSEKWRDAEDLNLSLKEVINKTNDMLSTTLDAAIQNAKSEIEAESGLRNRHVSAKVEMPNFEVAAAKYDSDVTLLNNLHDDVESGVEADENLDSESLDMFEDDLYRMSLGGSQTPPDGTDLLWSILSFFSSFPLFEMCTFVVLIGIGVFIFLPVTEYAKGFISCFLLLVVFQKVSNFFQREEHVQACIRPDYKTLPPLKVPVTKPVQGVWINEYQFQSYDPDYYSVSQTVPAYLELHNSILKLSRPKAKIHKRATCDEPDYKMQFVSQRLYNISGCNVFLMPDGLTRKRLYSKKYPIVIFLKPDSFIGERLKDKIDNDKEADIGSDLNLATNSENKGSLYLFARCDRQKEEWYRRLLSASRYAESAHKSTQDPDEEKDNLTGSLGDGTSTPFETLFFDTEITQLEEYMQYMTKYVDVGSLPKAVATGRKNNTSHKKMKSKKKESSGNVRRTSTLDLDEKTKNNRSSGTKSEESKTEQSQAPPFIEIQWLNAFVNRILFDVFRSPYWLAKIHDKLYRKLNSIRLPYYVEDIEVIELDLGKTGPTFHRVSQPYLDDRGLWFDMDTTFDGLIKLTIQTHLNLVKLQKGIEEEEAIKNAMEKTEREKEKRKSKEVLKERDEFLVKDPSRDKSDVRTSKKLQKEESRDRASSKGSTLDDRPVPESSDAKLEESKSTDLKLLREVAKMAEIALEEGLKKKNLPQRSPIYDSEVEDSAESSEDEFDDQDDDSPTIPTDSEEPSPNPAIRRYPKNRRSSKKLFRMFENVAQSKYFKSVAQSKYVQRAIAGVSATNLKLTLEIKSCTGTLAVNIPPPPSDRFWYGFREMPTLIFSANPKIGEKSVRFSHIKNYLQKKILHEIKKTMVVPNLIDIVLPTSEPGRSSSSQQIEQLDNSVDKDDSTLSEKDDTQVSEDAG